MKIFLSLLILSLLVVGLVAPVMAGAQDQKIKECCVCNQTINMGDAGTCAKDAVAAPDDAAKAACTGTLSDDANVKKNWGMFCLVNMVYIVTNWIFYLMMIAVVIVFVVAGAMYMMSSGDAEKTKSAKNLIIFGIVGLIVALVARLIPSVVKLIVGM